MNEPIISPDWVGRVIDGRFALQQWLGGSGRSGLFLTELQQAAAKKAAIRLAAAQAGEADALVAGWAKAANLSHPHLMRLFRTGRYQFGATGLAYVVMEYADEVLSQIIPQRPLTADETREMLGPVTEALEYLHGKGFVHGHVKPSNILVVNETLKLSSDNVVAPGAARNRFEPVSAYDAPELGSGKVTPAADVWSLGMTLVETLTQRVPEWDRTSGAEPSIPEQMPRLFAEIARGCLRRDPAGRCTLNDIKAMLRGNEPIAFPVQERAPEEAQKAEMPAAVVDPVPSETVVDAVEMASVAPAKMRLLPLVAVLMVVVVLFALFMLRGHPRQGEPSSTATETGAPSRSAAGSGVRKGEVAARTMPEVKAYARRTIRGTATVVVHVAVNANGEVTSATVESGGRSRYFARAAAEAARGWKFKPALKDGSPAASTWRLEFMFRREGDEATAVEEAP